MGAASSRRSWRATVPDVSPRKVPVFLSAALVGALALVGCGFQQQPGSYDDPKFTENYLNACTVDTEVIDEQRVDTPLAPESDCECILERITETLPFEELQDYEKEAESDPVSDPPPALQAAITECTQLGPQAPSSGEPSGSTTTVAP
jgi:hypothetical protein